MVYTYLPYYIENWSHLNDKNVRQWLNLKLEVDSQLKVGGGGWCGLMTHSKYVHARFFAGYPVDSLQTGD
jgi:hypothetical protein